MSFMKSSRMMFTQSRCFARIEEQLALYQFALGLLSNTLQIAKKEIEDGRLMKSSNVKRSKSNVFCTMCCICVTEWDAFVSCKATR